MDKNQFAGGSGENEGREKEVTYHRIRWNFEDTVKFYKSLHTMGTDFSSMVSIFPNRTRKSIKDKFKQEEKINGALIDKVLNAQGHPLNIDDVRKHLAINRTFNKLCAETAATRKKWEHSPRGSIGSVIDSRRQKNYFRGEVEMRKHMAGTGREGTLKPALASSIPHVVNPLVSRKTYVQKSPETEEKTSNKGNEVEGSGQTAPSISGENPAEPDDMDTENDCSPILA